MSAYIDPCDDCGPCEGCQRRWCPREEPSPGDVCPRCFDTEPDHNEETE